MSYAVNEIFYSLQGEGVRAGTPNIFLRFSGCNLTCKLETHGFDCDTEFVSGEKMGAEEIAAACAQLAPNAPIILTGGEPMLQVDRTLCAVLREAGHDYLAVETNGSIAIPEDVELDWITVSPKVAEHAIRQLTAHEVKYVRSAGQGIPKPRVKATHKLISPAFKHGITEGEDLRWCIDLVKKNPGWRLSVQLHKNTYGGIR